ncbi:MAG: multicopper oxidase domain-containing protein [Acidimicrobiales bacterium]|nr:multicopper oxidase domain-containing protein [Acidimicrobiales bacterium]
MTYKRMRLSGAVALAWVLAAAVMVPASSPAAAAGPDDIVNPSPFVWTYVASPEPHYVGVMEYGEATFTMNNGDTLTTRAYRQQGGSYSIPGPTLHMTPGNRYVVRFRNLLDYEAPSSDENVFKDPNITNLHTHGLHISGEGAGDDVTRMFEGGFGGDYIYDIPADHMGGTYWYHAHHHGATYLQVSTGGFGLIVIDDGQDGIPANVAAMEERELVIGYLDPSAAGTGGDTLISGTLSPGWTVNGKVGGTLTVPPDTWLHWRVLLADTDARTEAVSVGPNCEAELLARDGVWRTTAPKDLSTNAVELTGASRADLAVRCSGPADIQVGNTTVASVEVSGPADPGPHPYAADGVSSWSANRPSYLRDLSSVATVNTESVSIGARTINNDKFDPDTPTFTLSADMVQEWTLSGANNHPFHLHVYHMQTFGCGGDFEDGEYYDTVAGDCTVRFDLDAVTGSAYAGRTIMHCHILDHEDRGAMGWVDVIGGTPPPVLPIGQGYSQYYAVPADPPSAPSGLVATATSSSSVELQWVDNATEPTIFNIERSLDSTTFVPLATTAFDVTTYTDDDVDPGTAYWYRVNARNPAGTSSWSNTASATTPVAPSVRPLGGVVVEGSSGTTIVDVLVYLEDSEGNPTTAGEDVTVDFATVDTHPNPQVAQAGSDFISTAGTLTIPAGASQASVPVEVIGDTVAEPPLLYGEWGLVMFSNVSSNARLDLGFFGLGIFIIIDDD